MALNPSEAIFFFSFPTHQNRILRSPYVVPKVCKEVSHLGPAGHMGGAGQVAAWNGRYSKEEPRPQNTAGSQLL